MPPACCLLGNIPCLSTVSKQHFADKVDVNTMKPMVTNDVHSVMQRVEHPALLQSFDYLHFMCCKGVREHRALKDVSDHLVQCI